MDRPRRYNVRRVVNEARRLLEDEITKRVLYYGIRADGTTLDPAKLPHLTPADLETRRRLDQAIEKEMVGGLSRRQAVARYIRHVGFTYLNRFAALRAMEVRGFIRETVIPRARYGGRSLRERDVAEANPSLSPDQALRQSLLQAFSEVGQEIKVLFDTDDEYSLVFPEARTCRDLIQLLSGEIPEEDWHEDEIIGWIYQYYNEEARAEFKKSRRKPTADDIPVINQFYTPHWVVRVLADNTLGRLWLEMQGRIPNQRISESANGPTSREEAEWVICDQRIGVPDPRADPETFAAWLRDPASAAPADTVDTFCSYLVPLRNEPPPREKKQAREIKVLDPAAGSGHFLVYAFDILYRIYREDEPDTPPHEIPALILEHNLYGIDIDLRAVQLAALSLYLKARTAYGAAIRESDESPESVVPFRIRKLNLVCADARIADGRLRAEFLRRFAGRDRALQVIFNRLFEDLNNTNELGSLLKVREPFERLLEARKARLMEPLSPQMHLPQLKQQLDLSDVEATVQREQTLEDMLEALRQFEREAMEAQDMGTLLFATEAEKSVGLLALLSQKYDVVLMNPPYGRMPPVAKAYCKRHYPRTHHDIYAAFIEQTVELCQSGGFVGMLTSRTFMFLSSLQALRKVVLTELAYPEMIIECGLGVLDGAAVYTAASVVRKNPGVDSTKQSCLFGRLTGFGTDEKEPALAHAIQSWPCSKGLVWFDVVLASLTQVRGGAYAYWVPESVRTIFGEFPPLDRDLADRPHQPKITDAKAGLQTGDEIQFTRRFWEVGHVSVSQGRAWVPLTRDEDVCPYYGDTQGVVWWQNNGADIKSFDGSYVRNEQFYFRAGITWKLKSTDIRRFRYLPPGTIFDVKGSSLFPTRDEGIWSILALLDSSLYQVGMLMQTKALDWHVGYVARLPWTPFANKSTLNMKAMESYSVLREWHSGNETSTIFIKSWLLQVLHGFDPNERPVTGHPFAREYQPADWPSLHQIRAIRGSPDMPLRQLAELCVQRKEMMDARVEELQRLIDEEVYRLYEISDEDRALIERELALRRGEGPEGEEETEEIEGEEGEEFDIGTVENAEERIADHVRRLVSFYVRQAIEADEDGIVPLDESFDDNLVAAVRQHIATDFGADQVTRVEQEIGDILGKSLSEWLAQDYFDFHVSLYKRRPIFWQLASYRLRRGRGGAPGTFSCFLHYHKLTRDTIPKVQAFYLRPLKERAQREREYRFRELESARAAGDRGRVRRLSKEYEAAVKRIEELDAFDAALIQVHNPRSRPWPLPANPRWVDHAIAEVRDNGWTPILDHGVRVNIEPLKEAKLLHRAADRVK